MTTPNATIPTNGDPAPPSRSDARTLRDRVRACYGEPYYMVDGRLVGLNESYWAGLYATENTVVFEPDEQSFYRYNAASGIYEVESADSIRARISAQILDMARTPGPAALERKRTTTVLNGVVSHLRGIAEQRGAFARPQNTIHLANGVLVFTGDTFEHRPFSPDFRSRNRSPIAYDPKATCERFLGELIGSAVHTEDVDLLQRFAGMFLLGDNRAQRILILDGEAGRGKTQLANVLQGLVGMQNVTQLRTRLLGERFELYRFLGKTLLVGVDVEPDFLGSRGASVLKGLVGGDWFDAERKGGNGSFQMQGRFNVVITSNARLQVRLQGDVGAWQRRLTIVRYEAPPPRAKVPDFASYLIRAEGPGILNWAIEGALKVLREIPEGGGDLVLTPRQAGVVDSLMDESDSLRRFVAERVARRDGHDLTVVELMEGYARFCREKGWNPLSQRTVHASLEGLMLECHGTAKRHDIDRNGSHTRGFVGVGLSVPAATPTDAVRLPPTT